MKTKTKVISYIFRNSKTEVLVFKHRDFPEAGIQVVGGTVDAGEDLKVALKREILEEAGIVVDEAWMFLLGETFYQRKDRAEINHRHYFEVAVEGLCDSWSHTVTSTGEDDGMVFNFYWLPRMLAKEVLTGNFGELIT